MFLLPFVLKAQTSWTPQSTVANLTVNSNDKIESYTNSYGNHLAINSNGTIKYVLLNTSGGIIRERTIDTDCEFSNYTVAITAYQSELYIVYQKGINIKVAKSTNAGNSWSYTIPQLSIENSDCNGIDAVYDDKGLHVVWAVEFDNDSERYYETYYERYRRNPLPQTWEGHKQVTDVMYHIGGRPAVTTSPNKVHVSYNRESQPGIGFASISYTRDFNFQTSSWEAPLIVAIQNVPPPYPGGEVDFHGTVIERITSDDNYLHLILYEVVTLTNFELYYYLIHKRRLINSTSWETEYILTKYIYEPSRLVKPVFTNDQNLNVVGFINPDNYIYPALAHFYQENNVWYGPKQISDQLFDQITNFCLSSSSNDLYTYWIRYNSNQMFRSQYDQAPLAPTNLDYNVSANNHPNLTWSHNKEADFSFYQIYKKVTSELGFIPFATTSNNYYEDVSESFPVKGGQGFTHNVWYYVKSVDLASYYSPASNTLTVNVAGSQIEKQNLKNNKPVAYSLNQNYPNPFNPSTKISYSIKEDGFVSLKVYDNLGREVKTLVSENQPAGIYEVNFDASDLPSGMYIYTIRSGSYLQTRKMLLLK